MASERVSEWGPRGTTRHGYDGGCASGRAGGYEGGYAGMRHVRTKYAGAGLGGTGRVVGGWRVVGK